MKRAAFSAFAALAIVMTVFALVPIAFAAVSRVLDSADATGFVDDVKPAAALMGNLARADRGFDLARDAAGDVVIVAFGYSQCVDLCPFTLRKLDASLASFTPSDRVRAVYATVDPEHDDAVALRAFIAGHDARIDALRIEPAALASTLSAWHVIATKRAPHVQQIASGARAPYAFDHTATFFLVDTRGRLRARLPHDIAVDELTRDVRRLLSEVKP